MSEAAAETTEESTTEESTTEETTTESTEVKTTLGDKTDADTSAEEGDTDKSGESDEADEGGEKPGAWKSTELQMPEELPMLMDGWAEKIQDHPAFQKLTKTEVEDTLSMVVEWEEQKTALLIQQHNEMVHGWDAQLAKSKMVADRGEGGLEAVVAEAQLTQAEFFNPEDPSDAEFLRQLVMTGLGSHPALVSLFSKVAKAVGLTSTSEGGGNPVTKAGEKNLAAKWFPKSLADEAAKGS